MTRARSLRELNGGGAHRTSTALHQDGAARNRTRYVNSPVRGDAGNPETGALLHGHVRRERNCLRHRHNGIFGGGFPFVEDDLYITDPRVLTLTCPLEVPIPYPLNVALSLLSFSYYFMSNIVYIFTCRNCLKCYY